MLRAVASASELVSAYRTHGHLAATLDPLGSEPEGETKLDPRSYGLTPALQTRDPGLGAQRASVPGDTLAEILPRLRATYASTIAYEIEHISNTDQRRWLREYIESGQHRKPMSAERKIQLLERLTKVEVMERYMRRTTCRRRRSRSKAST